MLRKAIYPKVESLLNRCAGNLNNKGFSPNQLTLAGLALNFLAGWIYASGHLFLGAIVVILAALGDLLDGPLARTSGRTSKFGAFLDSTVDRYSDFFIFGGLSLFFLNRGQENYFLLTLGIVGGAFVTSYTKARGENFIPSVSTGFLERAERVILLIVATLFSPLLPWIIWFLFIGVQFTAVQRILFVKKQLSSSEGL